MRKKILIGVAAAACLGGGVAVGATAMSSQPTTPEWVQSDGTVDHSKVPACMKIVGRNGEVLTDGSGNPLCADTDELFAPPGEPPANGDSQREGPSDRTRSGREIPHRSSNG